MAGGSHVVVYDSVTKFVHAIFRNTESGSHTNNATYTADDYLLFSTIGKPMLGLGPNLKAMPVSNPTYNEDDFDQFGVFKVDNAATPTDILQRTDGERLETQPEDPRQYTYA